MKTMVIIGFSLFVLFSVIGCDDKSVNTIEENDPHKEIIINRQDFLYDVEDIFRECRKKVGGSAHTQPNGPNAVSVSKDKNIFYSKGYYSDLIIVNDNETNIESINVSSIQLDLVVYSVLNVVFSPYDNNLVVVLLEERKYVPEAYVKYNWYYYRIDTKRLELLNIDSVKHKDYLLKTNMLRWLNTSTPGNDKFFFDNNTILSYPSGVIEPNPAGLQMAENEIVVSVSPDMQKFFSVRENELYLNGRKVPSAEYVYWKNVPISWSDDSKYFLGVGIEENKKTHLNIVYRMEPGTNSSFKIHRIIDITRNFCSYQSPSGFGYDKFSQAVFKSESSIAMTLFPNLRDGGDLCEIGFNGKLIRKLTD